MFLPSKLTIFSGWGAGWMASWGGGLIGFPDLALERRSGQTP